MTQTMRLWTATALGRDALHPISAPIPTPRKGEVLVRVKAVSLNYRDKLVIESNMGLPLTYPFVPASDMAGDVVAIGDDVIRFQPGDRVIASFIPDWLDGASQGSAQTPHNKTLGGLYPGVLAQYVCFPEHWFVAAPASLDDGEASTLPIAGLTAWFALIERGKLKAGRTVVIQGTGGVALLGLQIAKAHGATVILTSSSNDKLSRAKALGADYLVNRNNEDWVQAVYRLTDGRGADHILELAGGVNLGRSVEAVAVGGHIAMIGVFEGFSFSGPAGPLLVKSPIIEGISVGHRRALEDLVRAVDATGLKPHIEKRYGFDDLPTALDHLDRGPFGKLVIEMDI